MTTMIQSDDQIYKKLSKLTDDVKLKLQRKGLIVPAKNSDGTITIGKYLISKMDNSLYCISEKNGDTVLSQINLPQTAIIIANNLALGRGIDRYILSKDQIYGGALFEEILYKTRIEHTKDDHEKLQTAVIKYEMNLKKKEECKREIEESFQKLMRNA